MPETYGGYTMPGNEFFYLSSMYSDKLLTEFLPKIKNRAYQRYMQIQKDILNGNEIQGTLEDTGTSKYYFKMSNELCSEFDFPFGSIFADITSQGFYLDIIDKLKFLRTFKSFYAPISYSDILAHPDIFSNMIRCRLGNYEFTKFYIMKDKFHRIFIGIKNSNTDGLTTTAIQNLLSEGTEEKPISFCLWKDDFSSIYEYNGTLNSIVSTSTDTTKKRITIDKTNVISSTALTEDNNWNLMMTYHTSQLGSYLYSTTDCNLVSESKTAFIFEVSSEFLDDISLRNSVVSCIVMQRPNRKVIYEYDPSSDTDPWLALGSYDKPVSIANIKIYEYDKTTSRYLCRKPLIIDNFNNEFNEKVKKENYNESNFYSNVIFPSIYSFDNIDNTIRLELIEYSSKISNTEFDNNIKALFQYPDYNNDDLNNDAEYSSDHYLNYLTWLYNNKDDSKYGDSIKKNLNYLTSFNPMNVYMDYDDYAKSGLNIRQYKFGKLMELINSDPYIYAEYIKFMDKLNFNIIKECGSPKHFKLNTGLTDSDLCGSNPIVTDDGFVNNSDIAHYFTEPHSYIKIHASNYDAFCLVYIGGRLITPTEIKTYLNDIYLFFPVSKVANYINAAINQNWNGTSLNKNNLITVECYNNVNRSDANRVYSTVIFESTSIGCKLFADKLDFNYKLSDLVIYDRNSGEYLPLSKFDITAGLKNGVIEFTDGTIEKISGSSKELTYMGTNLGEFYMTKDNGTLILEDASQDFDFPKDDFYGGRNEDYSAFLNKEWSNEDLKFKLNDPGLIGTEIEFVYSPVSYSWDIPFDNFTKENDNLYKYNISGFLGKNNISFFELYIDGEYINPKDFVILPDNANNESVITITLPNLDNINQWYQNSIHTIQLRYNPTTYSIASNSYIHILNEYDDLIDTESKYDLTKPIFYYNLFSMDLYFSNTTYLNSDCSKLFSKGDKDTSLNISYTWDVNGTNMDLQDKLNVLSIHPSLMPNPIFKDIKEDLEFYYLNKLNYPQSLIDKLRYAPLPQ